MRGQERRAWKPGWAKRCGATARLSWRQEYCVADAAEMENDGSSSRHGPRACHVAVTLCTLIHSTLMPVCAFGIVLPILPMRRLRFREVDWTGHNHKRQILSVLASPSLELGLSPRCWFPEGPPTLLSSDKGFCLFRANQESALALPGETLSSLACR